jgi:hypothetical protein
MDIAHALAKAKRENKQRVFFLRPLAAKYWPNASNRNQYKYLENFRRRHRAEITKQLAAWDRCTMQIDELRRAGIDFDDWIRSEQGKDSEQRERKDKANAALAAAFDEALKY